jgi:hypothetical protein
MARESAKNFTELDTAPAGDPEVAEEAANSKHPAVLELGVMRSILSQLGKLPDDRARRRVLNYLTAMLASGEQGQPQAAPLSGALIDPSFVYRDTP